MGRGPHRVRRVFIANRGVVALRVAATCRRLGIEIVIGVSEADRRAGLYEQTHETVCIGPALASASYLNRDAMVAAAVGCGADAVHPGYGFLAEDLTFAEMCRSAGLLFIGPSPAQLRLWGNKVTALEAARHAAVPVAEGGGPCATVAEAIEVAGRVGYPVILKPAFGGGGKGMRVVRDPDAVRRVFAQAGSEASAAFGDGALYVEKYLERARHVEVQVVGDRHGHLRHLADRDCTVQRRHQKLIEEAPAHGLGPDLQAAVRQAAVRLCTETGYDSIGTVEFLVEPASGTYVFLEVNPRLQVEHGVTELVTGLDLVRIQIEAACGIIQETGDAECRTDGAAIECRINAEDPASDFAPSPGRIDAWQNPRYIDARIDTHCRPGSGVPPFYDSLLANLMVRRQFRTQAIDAMAALLEDSHISGVATTIGFQRFLITRPEFRRGEIWTGWLSSMLESGDVVDTEWTARSAQVIA